MLHFTRLPPAPTLAPLVGNGDPRHALAEIAQAGFRFVQLSAALPGMKPRDLDRSARRDVLARLRRIELVPAGIDLWVPPEHYADPEQADRAAGAVIDAIELAADLGRIPLSVRLPEGLDESLVQTWRARAETCGLAIADHSPTPHALLGAGIDPAVLLAAGKDPALCVCAAKSLTAARFSDFRDESRTTPGTGRLDVLAYQVALVSRGFDSPLALDLRRVAEPRSALEVARRAWEATGLLTSPDDERGG